MNLNEIGGVRRQISLGPFLRRQFGRKNAEVRIRSAVCEKKKPIKPVARWPGRRDRGDGEERGEDNGAFFRGITRGIKRPNGKSTRGASEAPARNNKRA
jgi:hypothetical protein